MDSETSSDTSSSWSFSTAPRNISPATSRPTSPRISRAEFPPPESPSSTMELLPPLTAENANDNLHNASSSQHPVDYLVIPYESPTDSTATASPATMASQTQSSPSLSPSPNQESPVMTPPRPATPPRPTTPLVRHETFYLQEDPMVILRVEDCLYRVHRYFLIRESQFFSTMFELPSGTAHTEGGFDQAAVVLPDVTCKEFECLLKFFYDSMHDSDADRITLAEWVDILSMSTRFICDKIRDHAIREIDQHRPRINPIEKIILGFRFHVPQWLLPSYVAICQRGHPLEVEEAHKLGLELSVQLASAREAIRLESSTRLAQRANGARSQAAVTTPSTERSAPWVGLTILDEPQPYDGSRVTEIIRSTFPQELLPQNA